MRIPRDISGRELVRLLQKCYGYEVTRQTGSHIRLTRTGDAARHLTIPDHANVRIGTLSSIVGDVAEQVGLDRSAVINELFENR
ncbi:MAG: type II toxin-antitoxin system HicA family toxin [Fimbriimonadales bacterium]